MKVISEKILGGTMYAPFCRTLAADKSEWDADFANMQKLGFTCVHGFAEWHDLEYEKGKFDFSAIDYMLDCAQKYGIVAIVNIATMNSVGFYSPRWLMEECRGGEYVGISGRDAVEGMFNVPCMDNPTYWEYAQRYLTELGKHFAGDKRVGGYVLWGEPTMFLPRVGGAICYCEHTLARFRRWLEKKYGNIAELNALWATEGPTDFASFDEVKPPLGYSRQLGGYASWADWRTFMNENFCSHIKEADTILKAQGATQPTILEMLCDMNAGLSHCDEWELAKCVDIVGVSSFQQPGREVQYIMWESDSIAKAMGKTTFVVESLGGNKTFTTAPHTPTADEIQSNYLQRIMNGSKGSMYWCYRPRFSDLEGGEFGMTLRNGTPTYRAKAGGEISALAYRASETLAPMRRRSEVAIYTSATHVIEPDGVREVYENSRRGAAYMLSDLHINADFINDEFIDRLSEYKAVLLPFSYVMPRRTAQKIAEFVENGGVAIADYVLAFKQPNGICYKDLADVGLERTFGILDADTYIVRYHKEQNAFGIRDGVRSAYLYKTTAQTLASVDGEAVLAENVYGKGKAYYFANTFFAEYAPAGGMTQREIIKSVLEKAGVSPFLTTKQSDAAALPPLLCTKIESEYATAYSVFNCTETEIQDTVYLSQEVYKDLAGNSVKGKKEGGRYAFKLTLRPKETNVFITL